MKEWLFVLSEHAILLIEAIALVVIVYGSLEAFVGATRLLFAGTNERERRHVWLRFARWLVAGLTFQLAADIIETSITTDWNTLGHIAAIALIRTFLNYFLERDLAEQRELQHGLSSVAKE
jgi:uncharacterized membrane protein